MRARHVVGHRRYQAGAKDAHNNPVDGWADPVDLAVYAIEQQASTEPDAGRDEVVTRLRLFVTPNTVVDPRDLFVVGGREFKVRGDAADWTRGPFGFEPGEALSLERVGG